MKTQKIYCHICQKETNCSDINRFARWHLKKEHDISLKEYYDTYFLKEDENKCVMCGNDTKFDGFNKGYKKHCSRECLHKDTNYRENLKMKLKEYDRKIANEKRKKTCLEKYGTISASGSEEIKNKVRSTCMDKYGKENTLNLDNVKKQRINSLNKNKLQINEKRKKWWKKNKDKIEKINDNREKTCLEKYGNKFASANVKVKDKIRETNFKNKKWIPLDQKNEWEKYCFLVKKETEKHMKDLFENWDGKCYYLRNKIKNKEITIDHRISKYYGFHNSISPKIIGNIDNLCICSRIINCAKNKLTEEEFYKSQIYKKYIKTSIGDKFHNDDIEIETEAGFVPFTGIRKTFSEQNIKINLEKNYSISVSENHIFVVNNKEIIASNLKIGDFLETKYGLKKIIDIQNIQRDFVYDILGVNNKNSSYICNDINNHNCSFEGSSQTLIEGKSLTKLIATDPAITFGNHYMIWKKPQRKRVYAVSVDPSQGTYGDNSVINVYDVTDFPKKQRYEQVALYMRNDMGIFDFADELLKICGQWGNPPVIIENNSGMGDVLLKVLYEENDYEYIFFDYTTGKHGINANRKTKPLALGYFKDDVEGMKTTIHSEHLIKELSYFEEERDGVFKARKGNDFHDDVVTTAYWMSYFLRSKWWESNWEYIFQKNEAMPEPNLAEDIDFEEQMSVFNKAFSQSFVDHQEQFEMELMDDFDEVDLNHRQTQKDKLNGKTTFLF